MAMVCDACGTKYARDDGYSKLNVVPPRIDIKMIQAFVNAGLPIPSALDHEELDLCIGCTTKVLAHLGLPTDCCKLPQLPTPPPDPSDVPPAGALTLEDLKTLGLSKDPPDPPCGGLTTADLKALGIDPT